MAEERLRQGERIVHGLRTFAAAQSELGRMFAKVQRLHTTDAAAIVEILTAEEHGRPLSPARLAGRLALTTGATSSLLNRLEDAGHVRRVRGHSDRRLVTLHSTPTIHHAADAFFAPLTEQLQAVLSTYSAADLDVVEELVDGLRSAMTGYTTTVSDTTPGVGDPTAPAAEGTTRSAGGNT